MHDKRFFDLFEKSSHSVRLAGPCSSIGFHLTFRIYLKLLGKNKEPDASCLVRYSSRHRSQPSWPKINHKTYCYIDQQHFNIGDICIKMLWAELNIDIQREGLREAAASKAASDQWRDLVLLSPLPGSGWRGMMDGTFYKLCKIWGRRSSQLSNDLDELFDFWLPVDQIHCTLGPILYK